MRKMPIGEASRLPSRTGVYLFTDQRGNVLYVGKAKDIRRRVAQHVRERFPKASENPARKQRKRILMAATHSVAWLPADTELEALLLEESLIKTHRPSYNRRQNKFTRHVYLEISLDGAVYTVRMTDQPGTPRSHGPFFDKFYAQRLVAVLDEQFGISPPCGGGLRAKVPRPDAAERFLLGYDDGLTHSLQEEIGRLASSLQFERAATVRDQLSFCESYLLRQAFVRSFAFGTLLVSEVLPARGSEHYLFVRGKLVDHASRSIPESWKNGSARPELGPPEPQWLLFERALVVYSWLHTSPRRKGALVLRETEAQNDRWRHHCLDGRDDAGVMGSQVLGDSNPYDSAGIHIRKGRP
jgi:excinuclease UvrABC nuclease subunit